MLLLPLLALAAAWSHGQAQVLLKQTQASVTRRQTTTARIDCIVEGVANFQSANIHWYRQIRSKAPERILYIGSGQAIYDDNSYRNKYSSEKRGTNVCTLSVKDINSNDEGTYYCAYWQSDVKIFGSGTQLIVSNIGNSAPENTEILQKAHEQHITYVCLIEKFYPEVIRVTWTEGEKDITKDAVKGEAWKATKEQKYSISSWLTVPVENKDKNYYCKYEHESQKGSLPTQDSTKTTPQEENCITSQTGNGTVFNGDHLMHRTAYLVYIILLLKSFMYYLIVLFFIYRMWAPTKHQGKKA